MAWKRPEKKLEGEVRKCEEESEREEEREVGGSRCDDDDNGKR